MHFLHVQFWYVVLHFWDIRFLLELWLQTDASLVVDFEVVFVLPLSAAPAEDRACACDVCIGIGGVFLFYVVSHILFVRVKVVHRILG
jgi:hypothetical protein